MKKNYYTINQALKKIFFTFGKKRKIFFEFFYLFITIRFLHKISAILTLLICKYFGYEKYNNSKLLKLILFTGIRGMKQDDIFQIRETYFLKIKKNESLNFNDDISNTIAELRENGVCNVSNIININQKDVNDVNEYFLKEKFYNGHEPMQSSLKKMSFDELNSIKKNKSLIFDKGYYSFDAETQLNNPVINQLFYSDKLKKLSDTYCGFETEPYVILTMLNLPNKGVHPVAHYHRDPDDYVFLGFFIYWTNTDINNGATTFKLKSHTEKYKNGTSEEILSVKPGSIIAGDWMGLHKGNEKIEDNKYRLLTMVRFGKKINHTYIQTKSYYFF
jgi:hypothetical protein